MSVYKKMDKIEIGVYGLSYGTDNIYTIIFKEKEGDRILTIPIGTFEAQTIAVSLEGIKSSRPMTHDLIKNILDNFRVEINNIIIYKFENGIFYSLLSLSNNMEIDSRTSDAVTLAIKYNCKMYTYDTILNTMSDIISNSLEIINDIKKEDNTVDGLQKQLNKCIEEEDFETASVIRDKINDLKNIENNSGLTPDEKNKKRNRKNNKDI